MSSAKSFSVLSLCTHEKAQEGDDEIRIVSIYLFLSIIRGAIVSLNDEKEEDVLLFTHNSFPSFQYLKKLFQAIFGFALFWITFDLVRASFIWFQHSSDTKRVE